MAPARRTKFGGNVDDPSSSPESEADDSYLTALENAGSVKEKRLVEHNQFLSRGGGSVYSRGEDDRHQEEVRTSPLVSGQVLDEYDSILPQHGLLAQRINSLALIANSPTDAKDGKSDAKVQSPKVDVHDSRIYLNVNTPWSAFICGSQGSGKSHTLSCMLENCVMASPLSSLPKPLAAIVFHYDNFASYASGQTCEVAYLCSQGIPVTILVSPTNFWQMKKMYENLNGLKSSELQPIVKPMLLTEGNLNVARMKKLMAISELDGPVPLYVEAIMRILRQMAIDSKGAKGFKYQTFKKMLASENFSGTQNSPLKLRMDLLESFMPKKVKPGMDNDHNEATDWSFSPGTVTIVDLSCPFVDESVACSLFNICLEIFEEKRGTTGLVVALDEAHKFMTGTAAANAFTENLLTVIRQQRHLATRVIIATQEPTISPKLLDLSSMTIVHRFTSPEWFRELQAHLAAITTADGDSRKNVTDIMSTIVNLDAGQALLFSPTAMLGVESKVDEQGKETLKAEKLGMRYVEIRVRQRLTVDGGKSITAL